MSQETVIGADIHCRKQANAHLSTIFKTLGCTLDCRCGTTPTPLPTFTGWIGNAFAKHATVGQTKARPLLPPARFLTNAAPRQTDKNTEYSGKAYCCLLLLFQDRLTRTQSIVGQPIAAYYSCSKTDRQEHRV